MLHDERDAGAAAVRREHHAARRDGAVAGRGAPVEELLERLTAGLAGLGLHGVEQQLAALEQQVVRAQQDPAAVREAGRPPGALGFAGAGGGIRHVLHGAGGQLVQHLAGERGENGGGLGRRRGEVC